LCSVKQPSAIDVEGEHAIFDRLLRATLRP
jgi:hypothetical protein